MQQVDTSLPDKLTRAILERLTHELKNLRKRATGGGYQITINIDPDTGEFDIDLLSKIARVKVK